MFLISHNSTEPRIMSYYQDSLFKTFLTCTKLVGLIVHALINNLGGWEANEKAQSITKILRHLK